MNVTLALPRTLAGGLAVAGSSSVLASGCGCAPEAQLEVCASGEDEDLDGLVDCEDGDCWGSPSCPELTLTVEAEDARWTSEYDHWFESRGGKARLEAHGVHGVARFRTWDGTEVCGFTAEGFWVTERWAEYSPGGMTTWVDGLASTGHCGLTEAHFQGGVLGFEDSALGGVNSFVLDLQATQGRVDASGRPWLRGSFTTTWSSERTTSSGLGHHSEFYGRGPLITEFPWVRGAF